MAKIHVRARAVDMLGRQQIAGIPTAIHELFKNAHDAYATHVEVDYYRADKTFVLRDDGYGMTRDEFEDRWLTLGTESKVGANREVKPNYIDRNMPRRIILGEKGIGRLAIATIGRQVLILSRAKRKEGLQDLVVSFIHWGLFEVPGVDLDSIVIPTEILPGGSLPDETLIRKLTSQVADNVRALANRIPSNDAATILKELDAFSIFPEQADKVFGRLSLRDEGQGTHFYVMPADTILERDIDEIGTDDIAAPLQRMLLGFSNTMMPNSPPPVIKTGFRDHKRDGRTIDLIGEQEFFTPDEFESADHQFSGEIDEYGQFEGIFSIYGNKPEKCTFEWPDAFGKRTACGPFTVKFAYVQGLQKESLLPPEEFGRISAKLNKIGGLYIYRDGIRILPYGNSDYDFLSIERRRTKSAQDWFFSYRRMFGAIELSHKYNGNLMEKAGREGFITNTAYRQLREIMENLFMQLAKSFFRKGADRGGEFNQVKLDLQHQADLLKKREKRIASRKAKFVESLEAFFENVKSGKADALAEEIKNTITKRLNSIDNLTDAEKATHELLMLESFAKKKIDDLRSQFVITKARGFSTSKKTRASWHAYQEQQKKLDKTIFRPLSAWADMAITNVARKETIALDRARRAKKAIDDAQSNSLKITRAVGNEAHREAKALAETVRKDASLRISEVSEAIQKTLAEFARIDATSLTENEIKKRQEKLQLRITTKADEVTDHIQAVINQIHSMAEAIISGDSISDEEAAMEAEYLGAKEQLDLFTELAQVGTALGIVQHEFGATIRAVRENIERLGEWAELDEELNSIFTDIRASFDHLDGYLGMFTPLNRRLQRHKIPIVGEEIRRYLQHIFADRLERHNITMSATREFDQKLIEAYPSTYYPTFVNLIDNAIYWIVSRQDGERSILLDADEFSFSVTNTGPGIPLAIKDWIFGFANTEKEGGRGMGLYISKETLKKEGADIVLENPGEDEEPTFRIILPKSDEEIPE